jgi:hypothetical protein
VPLIFFLQSKSPRFGTKSRADDGLDAIDVPYEDGRYQITLDRNLGTYWLLLK